MRPKTVLVSVLIMQVGVIVAACSLNSGSSQLPPATASADRALFDTTPGGRVGAKVAMLLPLTAQGHAAVVANGLKQAGEMALFENNSPGFQLMIKDTKGTSEGATSATQQAVSEGAELIIGPMFSKSVVAVSKIARPAKIPVMAFSNDERVAGDGIYLISFLVRAEVRRIVSFAASQGHRQFAALIPENAFGTMIAETFRQAVTANDGIVAVVERYPAGTGGVLGPARKLIEDIKASEESGVPVDALFLPGGPDVLSSLGPILATSRLDFSKLKLIGTGGWDYPNLGRDRVFRGGWYPATTPSAWQAFSERFTRTYGTAPPRIASLAHNAVAIAARLAASNPKGRRYTSVNLLRSNGFSGADGAVRFTSKGLTERGLAVLEVQQFRPRIVSPAPQTFRPRESNAVSPARSWFN
ncbi:MAG: penicillin-binding protein activator [Hyphomicrobiaceae bacterium]